MKRLLFFFFILLTFACQQRNAIEDIESVPELTDAGKVYVGAFKKLDGTWNGQFFIYQDSLALPRADLELRTLSRAALNKPGIYLSDSLRVTQVYTSVNPYFQRVQITDTYADGRTVNSRGVNKVQNGELWCVVQKPDELIIHEGSLEGEDTIIWASSTSEKEEYFYETVSENTYEIVGWGYYGKGMDQTKSPPMWFYAKYEREQ
jgi:hypothetical protein